MPRTGETSGGNTGGNPNGTNPEGTNPEGTNPEGNNPEGTNPEGVNPEGSNPEGGNSTGANPEGDPAGGQPEGSPADNGTTATEQNPSVELDKDDIEKITEILGHRGRTALIATELSEADRKNVLTELVDLTYKQDIKGSKLKKITTMIPIIGATIRAGYITKHKADIEKKIKANHGDIAKTYEDLGFDVKDSQIINADLSKTNDRAWQLLKSAGYRDNRQIDVARSRLDQNDKVEKVSEGTRKVVADVLNAYYKDVKAGKADAELEQSWKEHVSNIYDKADASELDPNSLMKTLNQEKAKIEQLANNKEITDKKVEAFLQDHFTLYKATLKEGLYKEKEVDTITKAVVAKGLAGGILAALSTREISKAVRGAATTLGATGGIAGAVAGGILGGIRGATKAETRLADREISDANRFDVRSGEATENTGKEATPPEEGEANPEQGDGSQGEENPEQGDGSQGEENPEQENKSQAKKANKKNAILRIFDAYGKLERHFTKEEKTLKEIEDLRGRQNAADIINHLEDLIQKRDNLLNKYQYLSTDDEKKEIYYGIRANIEALEDAYFDVIARGQISSEKNIDLIKYDKNSDIDERGKLEELLAQVESRVPSLDTPEKARKAVEKDSETENSTLYRKRRELLNNYNEAEKLEKAFKRRSIIVNGVVGAAVGFGAGAAAGTILQVASEHLPEGGIFGILHTGSGEGAPEAKGDFELTPDEDGGFTLKMGNEELIGSGDKPGIDFENDGTLTSESEAMLKEAGIDFEPHMAEPIESARANVSLKEFFDLDNKEANNLTEITGRSWITDHGRDQIVVGGAHMDGDGNIVMQVAPTQNADVDLDGMKMFITPGNGNISSSIAVDVNPDGTVEIPAGSPAASFFEDGEFQGGYAEFGYETGNGHIDVLSTLGDGSSDIDSVSIPSGEASYVDGYSFTLDGETQEVALPDEIAASAKMEAISGMPSLKGTGETIYSETTGETTNVVTTSGEPVEVERFEHHGGYSDVYDSYFGEKDGVYNSGGSLVRQMLGTEAEGLTSQQADQLFLDKINSGEIAESDVIEDYLNVMGNSPEAIVTTRAMMGDFRMDLDGDGVAELIDTQDKINLAANILGSGDSESYDNFVNDTFSLFHERLSGGSIRFVDQSVEQYQYTTWGILGKGNDILQRLGIVGDRPTDGVGLIFMDKNGNSIYDEATVRKLWHLPDDYDINYIADRLDCIQKTTRGGYPDNPGETTPPHTTNTPPHTTDIPPHTTDIPPHTTDTPPDTTDTPPDTTDTPPDSTTPPSPTPTGHTPKNEEAERQNAGDRVDQQPLDESVTPKTTEQEVNNAARGSDEQVARGDTAGSAEDKARQSDVDNSAETKANDQASTASHNDSAAERAAKVAKEEKSPSSSNSDSNGGGGGSNSSNGGGGDSKPSGGGGGSDSNGGGGGSKPSGGGGGSDSNGGGGGSSSSDSGKSDSGSDE